MYNKSIYAIVFALLLSSSSYARISVVDSLSKHIHYLASDELQGRASGTSGNRKAREYIVSQYKESGIVPLFGNGFNQYFEKVGKTYCNAVGLIEGSDPELKNEYIVLGAHFDHLGERNGKIYPGADDNASGSAALIEAARFLVSKKHLLKRSIIVAAFDAEELGLFGSTYLAEQLADSIGIDKIKLMMSIDMVGYYRQNGALILQGTSTIQDGRELISEEAAKSGITVKTKPFENSVLTATDTEGFACKGVPTLSATTGLEPYFHGPKDTADVIDYEGLGKITEYIGNFAVSASNPDVQPSGKVALKHKDYGNFEFGINIGTGSDNMNFNKGGFSTMRAVPSISAGISIQYLPFWDKFGFRTGVYFEKGAATFPNEKNLYNQWYKYSQNDITVPFSIAFRASFSPSIALFVELGGYYSHILNYKCETLLPGTVKRDQFGLMSGIGFEFGPVVISCEGFSQKGYFFEGPDVPRTQYFKSRVKIGFRF